MNILRLPFLLGYLLTLAGAGLHAQTTAPLERVNVFPDVVHPSPPVIKKEENERPVWSLKFSPTLLVRGELPLFVEHKMSDRYGLEAALGITFEDYFKETLFQSRSQLRGQPDQNKLSGITAKLSLHCYTGKGIAGPLYLAPEIDFKNYRKDVHGVFLGADGRYTSGLLRDQQIYTDVKAVLGYQTTELFDRDFFFDWFIGIGLRMGSENNVVNDEQNASVIRLKHVNVLSPVLSLGVKLGFGL